MAGTVRDVTETHLAKAARESEERLRHLGDGLPDSAVYRYAHESDGTPRFYYISAGIEQLNGVRIEDVLCDAGVLLRQILPEYLPQLVEAERRSARDMSDFKMEVPMRRPDGEVRWMRLQCRPHRGQDGALIWDGVQTDITDHQRAEEALRESEEKLRLALDAAELGIWRWDAGNGTEEIQWDSRCRALFGVPADAYVTHETWANCIVPEDKDQAEASVARALDPGDPHDETVCEYRVTLPDGTVRWLCSTGRAYFEPDTGARSGRRLAFKAGAIRDVTQVRLAEAALRESEERFRGIFEHAGTGIGITDLEGRFQSCNPAYSTMLGYSEKELRELAVADIQHPDDRDTHMEELRQLLEGKIPSFEIVNRLVGKDGRCIWVHKYISFLRDASGRPTNLIGLITDMTERKRQDDQIHLLMREVNHRSKNMLTVVQAIARQTAAANPIDFVARFEERTGALAANQDLLVKNTWRGADLNELVRSQLAHFEDLIGTRIELQGPPCFVSASAAQTLAMALHELATNAGKYGALANGNGHVLIEWSLERANAGAQTFVMAWREQSMHPIRPPSKRGFGSSVICDMAELSLDAKVELDFPATGLVWRLRCPAGQVLKESNSSPVDRKEKPAGSPVTDTRPRIFVVEDEALVAIEIAQMLKEAGFEVVGPARTVNQALQLVNESGCDAAILDINLGSETSEPVALRLRERGSPFVTVSGYSREQLPPAFDGIRLLAKPVRPQLLIAELRKCIAQKCSAHR
jgi:PAS domain S-box-containing protein